jgi:poly(3-hydroxybutyrate) depolymerase
VSVLSIHGASDQVVPYRGLRAFLDTWARRDRCAPRPTARLEVEGITHLRWHGCAAGTRVEHLRVAHDTHGWPSITDANERMVASYAPRVETRPSARGHRAGHGSGQMMGRRRLNRTGGGPTKGA